MDMLLEMYRIDRRSKKWYMRIVYWSLGVAILLYRRHQQQLRKREAYNLTQFQAEISSALCKSDISITKKRGEDPEMMFTTAVPKRAFSADT